MCHSIFPRALKNYPNWIADQRRLTFFASSSHSPYAGLKPCYCKTYPHIRKLEPDEKIYFHCYELDMNLAQDMIPFFEYKLPKDVLEVIGVSFNISKAKSIEYISQKFTLQFNANKDLGGVYYPSVYTVKQQLPIIGGYTPINVKLETGAFVQGWAKDLGSLTPDNFPFTLTIILTCITKRKNRG